MTKTQRRAGMLLSYIGTLLLIAVNIFLTPFLIGSLGKSEYGVYQMMMSFAGYLVLINFGTGTVMTRYVSAYLGKKDKKGEENFIAMCLIVTGILAVAIVAVATVLYYFLGDIYGTSFDAAQLDKARRLFVVISGNLVITLISQAFQGIITAYEKFVFLNVWNIVKILLKAGLVVTLFMFRADSLIIVVVDLGLSVVFMLMCIAYVFSRLRVRVRLYRFDRSVFSSSVVFSFAIFLQSVVNQVNGKVDITILGIMQGTESVTRYSVAMQIYSVFSSLSSAAIAVYLPKFSRLVSRGETSGKLLTREMIAPSRIQTLVSGTVMFGFLLCGRDFISVWVGDGYELSWWTAVIVIIPMFLAYINGIMVSVLDAMQKRLVRSAVLASVAVVNIGISIVLVNFFGEIGAPIGTAIATLAGSVVIMNIYYKKAIGIKLGMLFFGICRGIMPCLLIAAAATLPAVLLIDIGVTGLVVKLGVFLAVLTATLLLFGLNTQEKQTIFNKLKRRGEPGNADSGQG